MPASEESRSWRPSQILLIVVLCLAATLLLRVRTDMFGPASQYWNDPVDHWKYEYVAEHPLGSFHIQPTAWRIGVPLLTRLLPFSTYRNFEILTLLFYVLTGVVIYFWLLAIPRPRDEAVLGVVMFYSMGSVVKLVLSGVETPDPGSYFFIMLAVYAIYSGNDYLCAAALALGILTKETLLVAVPLHYSLKATRLLDFARLKKSILVGLPAVCIFLAIRILIPAWNDRPEYVQSLPFIYTQVSAGEVKYDIVTAFKGTIQTYRELSGLELVRLLTWRSLGISMFLPFFDLRSNKEVFLRWSPYWVPTLGTLLIALSTDRRVGSLFPLLIVAGLNGISVLSRRLGITIRQFQIVFAIQFALLLLRKDPHVIAFDIVAAVFLGSLCWFMTRSKIAPPQVVPG